MAKGRRCNHAIEIIMRHGEDRDKGGNAKFLCAYSLGYFPCGILCFMRADRAKLAQEALYLTLRRHDTLIAVGIIKPRFVFCHMYGRL
jgi:hypothetical protein